jgi:hypothetical protein
METATVRSSLTRTKLRHRKPAESLASLDNLRCRDLCCRILDATLRYYEHAHGNAPTRTRALKIHALDIKNTGGIVMTCVFVA